MRRRQKMSLEELRAKKLAFAASKRIEACVNDACGYDACECGAACACELANVREAERKTCEPCVKFKAEKIAAREGRAAE